MNMIILMLILVSCFCGCCNIPQNNRPEVIWTSKSGFDTFGEISNLKFSNAGVWAFLGDRHVFSGNSRIESGERYEMKLKFPNNCEISHFSVHPEYSISIRNSVNQYKSYLFLESISVDANNCLHVVMKPGPARIQYWSVGFK